MFGSVGRASFCCLKSLIQQPFETEKSGIEGMHQITVGADAYLLAGSLLTQLQTRTSVSLSRSPLEPMNERPGTPGGLPAGASLASSDRDQWAWLDSLGRSLECAILLVDAHGTPGPVVGTPLVAETLRGLLTRSDASLTSALRRALDSDRAQQATVGALALVCRRLGVQGTIVGALAIAAPTVAIAPNLGPA